MLQTTVKHFTQFVHNMPTPYKMLQTIQHFPLKLHNTIYKLHTTLHNLTNLYTTFDNIQYTNLYNTTNYTQLYTTLQHCITIVQHPTELYTAIQHHTQFHKIVLHLQQKKYTQLDKTSQLHNTIQTRQY